MFCVNKKKCLYLMKQKQKKTFFIMEETMKIAVELYSELTGRKFQEIYSECLSGNQTIIESIQLLMFSVAS